MVLAVCIPGAVNMLLILAASNGTLPISSPISVWFIGIGLLIVLCVILLNRD